MVGGHFNSHLSRPLSMEAIAIRLEAFSIHIFLVLYLLLLGCNSHLSCPPSIASRLEAIAIRLETTSIHIFLVLYLLLVAGWRPPFQFTSFSSSIYR